MIVTPPSDDTSQYRTYDVMLVPALWDQNTCDEYIQELTNGWTSYGYHRKAEGFLVETGLARIGSRALPGQFGALGFRKRVYVFSLVLFEQWLRATGGGHLVKAVRA